MTFTTGKQIENRITRTTTQTVNHSIYNNTSVNITGLNGNHNVWLTQGKKVYMTAEDLDINSAVVFANKLIASI